MCIEKKSFSIDQVETRLLQLVVFSIIDWNIFPGHTWGFDELLYLFL
jgi:hypothetical protein